MSGEFKFAYQVLLFLATAAIVTVLVICGTFALCKEIKARYSANTTPCEKCMKEVKE